MSFGRWRHNLLHPLEALDAWWFRTSPNRRLDHNPANACMLIGLMFPCVSIALAGPVPNSSVADVMPKWLQMWMAGMIFVGTALKFIGIICGSRWFLPHMKLKNCYSFGFIGAPFASSGLFVYGFFQAEHTTTWTSAFTAVLTPMLGTGIGLQAILYWLEYRRITHNEAVMLEQVKAKIQDERDHST